MKKNTIGLIIILAASFATACGSSVATNSVPATTKSSNSPGSPSATVTKIYDAAIKRECSAITPMLTTEFASAVGTSKDSLDALCDSFTDSGKLVSIELGGETITGDAATVTVTNLFTDGRRESKQERMKKSGDRWLMDS